MQTFARKSSLVLVEIYETLTIAFMPILTEISIALLFSKRFSGMFLILWLSLDVKIQFNLEEVISLDFGWAFPMSRGRYTW